MFNRSKRDDGGYGGDIRMSGAMTMERIEGISIPTVDGDLTYAEIKEFALPHNGLSADMTAWKYSNLHNINRGLRKIIIAKENQIPTMWGVLNAKKICADGEEIDYGIVSLRVVTDVGVNAIAALLATTSINFKYHGLGTGTTNEATGDTALVTELTTEYSPDSTRATGSQSSSTNTYITAGTNTLDGSAAITEHGVFSAASAGTLLDRSKFLAINLSSGDGLLTTYTLTLSSGG